MRCHTYCAAEKTWNPSLSGIITVTCLRMELCTYLMAYRLTYAPPLHCEHLSESCGDLVVVPAVMDILRVVSPCMVARTSIQAPGKLHCVTCGANLVLGSDMRVLPACRHHCHSLDAALWWCRGPRHMVNGW